MNRATRSMTAALVRHLPAEHRGRQRLMNALDTRTGVKDPLVTARMKLGYRMRVDLRSRTEVFAYYTGGYDTELIRSACGLLPSGGIAIDIGANVGFWSVPFAQRGTVHAFEPVPSNAARLRENGQLNGLSASLTVHELALSDKPGKAFITLREDFQRGATTGNAAIVIDADDERFERHEISLDTLDKQAEVLGLDRLDVMKIDIEGHEDLALLGARATLDRFRPLIWVEWNRSYYDRRGVNPTAAFSEALDDLEYTYLRRHNDGWHEQARFESPKSLDDLVLVPHERAADITQRLA